MIIKLWLIATIIILQNYNKPNNKIFKKNKVKRNYNSYIINNINKIYINISYEEKNFSGTFSPQSFKLYCVTY